MRTLPILALTLALHGCGQTLADSHATIRLLEDRRTGADVVAGYLSHDDPGVRAAAALGLGRIEDSASQTALTAALTDPAFKVRVHAAFALGQLGDAQAEARLLVRLSEEPHPIVRMELWRALGRIGLNATVAVAQRTTGMERPLAVTTAGLALRRMKQSAGNVPWLVEALRANSPEVRAATLYAFHRSPPGPLPPTARVAAALGLSSSNGAERETSVRVLARGADGAVDAVAAALTGPQLSAQQRTLLVKGLAKTDGEPATKALLATFYATARRLTESSLVHPDFHVLLAAAHGLTGRKATVDGTAIHAPKASTPPQQRRHDMLRCSLEPTTCPIYVRAGQTDVLDDLRAWARHESARVRMAAIERLAALKQDVSGAVSDPDLPVAATAAAHVTSPEAGPALLATWKRALGQADYEVAQDILRALMRVKATDAATAYRQATRTGNLALARLGRKALDGASASRVSIPRPPMPALTDDTLAPFRPRTRPATALVKTEIGEIELRLHTGLAPGTVDSFVTLARRGFYNGLAFHRVVADFVVQGGDPRGDGWGGPGYTLRCENNPRPYVTGTVGMALAGKDTGGSQWFITHSAQPHLLGTYTVFAQVARGQEIVDTLVPSDRILSIEVAP